MDLANLNNLQHKANVKISIDKNQITEEDGNLC